MTKKNSAQDSSPDTPGDDKLRDGEVGQTEVAAPLGSDAPTEEFASPPGHEPLAAATTPPPAQASTPTAPATPPPPPIGANPAQPVISTPPAPRITKPSDNPYAMISLFSGIAAVPLIFVFGIGAVPAIMAIVAGHIALRQIKAKDRLASGGETQAKVGLGLGYGTLALGLLVAIIGGIAMLASAFSFGNIGHMHNDRSNQTCVVDEDGDEYCYGSNGSRSGHRSWGSRGADFPDGLQAPEGFGADTSACTVITDGTSPFDLSQEACSYVEIDPRDGSILGGGGNADEELPEPEEG